MIQMRTGSFWISQYSVILCFSMYTIHHDDDRYTPTSLRMFLREEFNLPYPSRQMHHLRFVGQHHHVKTCCARVKDLGVEPKETRIWKFSCRTFSLFPVGVNLIHARAILFHTVLRPGAPQRRRRRVKPKATTKKFSGPFLIQGFMTIWMWFKVSNKLNQCRKGSIKKTGFLFAITNKC